MISSKSTPGLRLAATILATLTLSLNTASADGASRADDHAPIGVMADHMHKAGEWMVSLRHMRMDMKGNRIGRDKVSDAQVLQVPNENGGPANLRVVPRDMQMDMTMLGMMYAPNDDVTLMVMTQYLETQMTATSYSMAGGNKLGTFSTRAEGVGDTTLAALVRLPSSSENPHSKWHASFGLSVPTGSIKHSDIILTPMNTLMRARLPYAMQLGSGTYDLKPSLTYNGKYGAYTIGAQLNATLRLDDNSQGYKLGDKAALQAWAMTSWSDYLSTSLRIKAETSADIEGEDAHIDKPVQSAHTGFYGGERVHLAVGVNYLGHAGFFDGHRLAFEVVAPVYENLHGPQMSQDITYTLGYQKAW